MNTDQHDVQTAIDKAIADLVALRASILPSRCLFASYQAASAQSYLDYTYEAHRIGAELTVALARTASWLGDKGISDGDEECIRSRETLDYALFDAKDWTTDILGGKYSPSFKPVRAGVAA